MKRHCQGHEELSHGQEDTQHLTGKGLEFTIYTHRQLSNKEISCLIFKADTKNSNRHFTKKMT